MKNIFITIVTMLFVTAVFCLSSCSDEASAPVNVPGTPAAITIESAGDTSATAFNVTLTPSANAVAYTFAIGTPSDYALFVSRSSTLKTIEDVTGNNDTTITFSKLDPGTEYAVFAQAYTAEGYRSEVTTFTVPTKGARVSVHIDELTTIYADITTEIIGEVKEYYAVTASKADYDELLAYFMGYGYTEIEFIKDFVGDYFNGNEQVRYLINGGTNIEHVFVVLPYAADGTPLAISRMEYTSPAFRSGLPIPCAGTITVSDIQDNTARVVIEPGKDTYGFYAGVFTTKEFAELTPEELIYESYGNLSAYSYPMFETDDYVWRGLASGTGHIIVVAPFNENGTDGWGPLWFSEPFTTTGSAPGPPAPAPGPGSISGKHPAGNGLALPGRQAVQYKKALTKSSLEELKIKRK